ncbi:MAG: cyclic pyranopterin monophosphate synthase MoaC [Planctomycetota bacterium]|nr:cyclic pyranopterin monophosphate synthase MoaC [Planctomycetota bacterium]
MNISDDPPLSHTDEDGRSRMVDVGDKEISDRRAKVEGFIRMNPATLKRIIDGKVEKGDVLSVARLAAIQGAKETASMIPLCHPLPLDNVQVEIEDREEDGVGMIRLTVSTRVQARTGVEMEAFMAVSNGLLTIYDMCKAVDRGMEIGPIRLLEKSGGRSGDWVR